MSDLDNTGGPTYPMTRVRVHERSGVTWDGRVVGCRRMLLVGWDVHVLPDGEHLAIWFPTDQVTPISAVEQLGKLVS